MAAVAGYYEEAQGEQQGDESMEVRTNCDLIDGGIADMERGGPGNILVCLVIRLDNKSLPCCVVLLHWKFMLFVWN